MRLGRSPYLSRTSRRSRSARTTAAAESVDDVRGEAAVLLDVVRVAARRTVEDRPVAGRAALGTVRARCHVGPRNALCPPPGATSTRLTSRACAFRPFMAWLAPGAFRSAALALFLAARSLRAVGFGVGRRSRWLLLAGAARAHPKRQRDHDEAEPTVKGPSDDRHRNADRSTREYRIAGSVVTADTKSTKEVERWPRWLSGSRRSSRCSPCSTADRCGRRDTATRGRPRSRDRPRARAAARDLVANERRGLGAVAFDRAHGAGVGGVPTLLCGSHRSREAPARVSPLSRTSFGGGRAEAYRERGG